MRLRDRIRIGIQYSEITNTYWIVSLYFISDNKIATYGEAIAVLVVTWFFAGLSKSGLLTDCV